MYTETLTQRLGISNPIVPETLNNSYDSTGSVDLAQFRRAFFELCIAAITGGGAITASLQESADNSTWPANGTAGAFTGSAGTGLQLTGLNTANRVYTFEVRADQLSPGKRYVRLNVGETAGQNVVVACSAHGDEAIHKPGNVNNGNKVTTQNVVS